jgi:hypothetical protein
MTPAPVEMLLAELTRRDVELRADGDRVRFRPLAAVTPDLAERLRQYKAEVLAVLRAATGPAAEADALIRGVRAHGDADLAEVLAEVWYERLAICAEDGGLIPADAEAVALKQLHTMLAETASMP